MTSIMIASNESITDGQIENAVNRFRDALRTKRNELPADAVQRALGASNLGRIILEPFRRLVEMESMVFRRRVLVPARSFRTALDATGCRQRITIEVANAVTDMTEEVEREVFLVKPPETWYTDGYISSEKLLEFFDIMSLEADPHGAATVNEADKGLSGTHPNAAVWKHGEVMLGSVIFYESDLWRNVEVKSRGYSHEDNDWDDTWRFAVRFKE